MVERLFNTEEEARFKSCSAYQASSQNGAGKAPEILFLSHCVPNPPDKGEKIRAYHLLDQLLGHYRVHLVCFTRNPEDVAHAHALKERCESVYVELLPATALLNAGVRFALGRSLTTAFYRSRRMEQRLSKFRTSAIAATVVFSSVMANYAPAGIPMLIDMVDVDSEKWMQYGEMRSLGFLYRLECLRLRAVEREAALRANCTFLTTAQEQVLLETIAPGARVRAIENGVDFEFFDPRRVAADGQQRPSVAFVGVMDYYPNADACCWFADHVIPALRARVPEYEFVIVGRNPSAAVERLGKREGIRVLGGVPDVRPYIAGARAVVAPLRIARGVQNKVLEALAMGKPVLASDPVCRTFGEQLPVGVTRCWTARDYVEGIEKLAGEPSVDWQAAIRESAQNRFQWESNMRPFLTEMEAQIRQPA